MFGKFLFGHRLGSPSSSCWDTLLHGSQFWRHAFRIDTWEREGLGWKQNQTERGELTKGRLSWGSSDSEDENEPANLFLRRGVDSQAFISLGQSVRLGCGLFLQGSMTFDSVVKLSGAKCLGGQQLRVAPRGTVSSWNEFSPKGHQGGTAPPPAPDYGICKHKMNQNTTVSSPAADVKPLMSTYTLWIFKREIYSVNFSKLICLEVLLGIHVYSHPLKIYQNVCVPKIIAQLDENKREGERQEVTGYKIGSKWIIDLKL